MSLRSWQAAWVNHNHAPMNMHSADVPFGELFLIALGAARPRFFLLPVQKKETKEKDTRRLAPRWRKGCPALLGVSGARELPRCARSDMHALASGNTCDARLRQRGGSALSRLRRGILPSVQPSTAGQNREKRGLFDRPKGGSSAAPVLAEERRVVGAQRRPSRRVPFLLPSFLWASKEKKGWCAESSAIKTSWRMAAQRLRVLT